MNWLKRLFGSDTEKTPDSTVRKIVNEKAGTASIPDTETRSQQKSEFKRESSVFPGNMLGRVSMVIINYEGQKDRDLQQKVVSHLMPLMRNGGGFVCYSNASLSPLASDERACSMITFSGGFPRAGVSLDSYMAYIASKDSFPTNSAGYGREYGFDQIGYWYGNQNGVKVHAILLF